MVGGAAFGPPSIHSGPTACGMMSTFRMGFPCSAKPFWTQCHRPTQRGVSMVILSSVRSTVKINCHSLESRRFLGQSQMQSPGDRGWSHGARGLTVHGGTVILVLFTPHLYISGWKKPLLSVGRDFPIYCRSFLVTLRLSPSWLSAPWSRPEDGRWLIVLARRSLFAKPRGRVA